MTARAVQLDGLQLLLQSPIENIPRTASWELPPIVFSIFIIFRQKAAVNEVTIQIVWVASLFGEESAVLYKNNAYKLYDFPPYKLYDVNRQKSRNLQHFRGMGYFL